MRPVHDHLLESYMVDCERRLIVLHTRLHADEILEQTDVTFSEVAAYAFEGDCFGNILLDIEETDGAGIVDGQKAMFDDGRRYGWPGPWNTTHEAAVEFVRTGNFKGFIILATAGFNGWVLARDLEIRERAAG